MNSKKMINVLDLISDKMSDVKNKMYEVQGYIENYDEWDEYLDSLYDRKNKLLSEYDLYYELYREILEIIKGGD